MDIPDIRIHIVFQFKELLAKNTSVQIIQLHGILAFGFTLTHIGYIKLLIGEKKRPPHPALHNPVPFY